MTPTKIYFTKGYGVHKDKLVSFELALRAAGIERFNLVTVSSIFPAKAVIVTDKSYIDNIEAGSVVFCVMSRCESNEPDQVISASVGLAKYQDANSYGYLSEYHESIHHLQFENENQTPGEYAEGMAVEMLQTIQDQSLAFHEMIKHNTTSTYKIKGDSWATVIAAAILIE